MFEDMPERSVSSRQPGQGFSCVLICEADDLGRRTYEALIDNGIDVKAIWSCNTAAYYTKSHFRLAFSSKKTRQKHKFSVLAQNHKSKIVDISGRDEKCLNDALARSDQPDFILIAGSMVIISAAFLDNLAIPIINIHPTLLPAYRGPAPYPALFMNISFSRI